MEPTVLTIAGSDPTGGAGLQADIKTMTVIGVYAAAVVTCITVQNSRGVTRVVPLDRELVKDQIKAVLEDHNVTHIKIGMIGTAEIADSIDHTLDGFRGEIIVDPVLVSTTGQELFQFSSLAALKTGLLKKITVITPNIPELKALTGIHIETPEDTLEAGDNLMKHYDNLRAVIIKGGHAKEEKEVTDILLYRKKGLIRLLSSTRPYVNSRNTHGTGCALASAYAAYHCKSGDDELAFFNSTNFIQRVLERSKNEEIINNPEGCGGLLFRPDNND